jgi:hypothetical protein
MVRNKQNFLKNFLSLQHWCKLFPSSFSSPLSETVFPEKMQFQLVGNKGTKKQNMV